MSLNADGSDLRASYVLFPFSGRRKGGQNIVIKKRERIEQTMSSWRWKSQKGRINCSSRKNKPWLFLTFNLLHIFPFLKPNYYYNFQSHAKENCHVNMRLSSLVFASLKQSWIWFCKFVNMNGIEVSLFNTHMKFIDLHITSKAQPRC